MHAGVAEARARIGDFTLLEEVHQSPFARTYRARGDDGVLAAVKRYAADAPIDPARIVQEQQVLAELSHPAVARYLRGGEHEGLAYVATAWVEGETLAARLARGPMPWQTLAPLATSVAEALHAVHRAGLVHRDLKASNVMCARAPAGVLLDFGHALDVSALEAGDARLTDRGWIVGTAAYMAPERIQGARADGRADLYSLGVLLYRALTGALPFDNVSVARVLEAQLHEPVRPPRELVPSIRASVEALVLWLLAKDPGARLPSAHVLLCTLTTL